MGKTSVYFTSDLHLSDIYTLQSDLRPFKNTKQFDKVILKNINKQAKAGDTIYVVGDFIDCDGEGHEEWKKSILLVKKIKANVVLILGNNEERVIKYYFNNNFEEFKNFCLSIGFKDVVKTLILTLRDKEFYLVQLRFVFLWFVIF